MVIGLVHAQSLNHARREMRSTFCSSFELAFQPGFTRLLDPPSMLSPSEASSRIAGARARNGRARPPRATGFGDKRGTHEAHDCDYIYRGEARIGRDGCWLLFRHALQSYMTDLEVRGFIYSLDPLGARA
jgi:hypothetical protein